MLYGADYNPEQWPEEIWPEDVRLMREAGVTTVSLGIFSWSRLQPAPDVWDFAWLDRVIDLLHAGGVGVNLATATASPPPWMTVRHPEILAADENGAPYWHGSRQHHSPASPTYRRLAGELVRRLAERYARHPAVVMWHVGNESGCHLPVEYSDAARDAFRGWLRARYETLDALNDAWGTSFWSQRYGDWDEVFPPRKAPYARNPSQVLDYRRFMSDMWLECYLAERDILRAAGATQPISTNMMGAFKPADYASWAPHIDVITDDCYPDPLSPTRVRDIAFQRDLVRSLKRGRPWLLMEQATDAVNWRPVNPSKRDDQLFAETAQAIGRGADGILFFQWRQSRAGSERFHSAMLPHAGQGTRTWREVTALGTVLGALPELPPPGDDAPVALVFDWENWWAVEGTEHPDHPAQVDYLEVVRRWYGALHRRGIMVDVVRPEDVDGRYRLAIAPLLHLLREGGSGALASFVDGGGTLLTGPFSDIVDEHDRFRPGGFLTQLGPMLGVGLEDFRAVATPVRASGDVAFTGSVFAEALFAGDAPSLDAPSHDAPSRDAEVLAAFEDGPSAGRPALTRRAHGAGSAWYVATVPDEAGVDAIIGLLVEAAGVVAVTDGLPEEVEVARRGVLVTYVNHGDVAVEVDGVGRIPAQGAVFLLDGKRLPTPTPA